MSKGRGLPRNVLKYFFECHIERSGLGDRHGKTLLKQTLRVVMAVASLAGPVLISFMLESFFIEPS